MAYQIDFTASNYVNRARRKWCFRMLLVAAVVGVAWGAWYIRKVYNQPTLNMKLAEYEMAAYPIEEMNAAWDRAAKEWDAMLRYYRLVWAANPTNFLGAMTASDAPRLVRALRPRSWTLKTGGECELGYRYVFTAGDKAEQVKGLEAKIVNAVTSIVEVVDGKVDVQGVQHENLLNVDELGVVAKFALPNARKFPAKEPKLVDCVKAIAARRKLVQESKFAKELDIKGVQPKAQDIMMKYLAIGREKPDYPSMTNVLNVAGWFERADQFIKKHRIPGAEDERRQLKSAWNKIGNARYPWDRYRVLDNDDLVLNTKELGVVADGVKRFKGFLDRRHVDCEKKLEPFIDAYDHNDVFNQPLVESDLKERTAKEVGIAHSKIAFKDEPNVEPPMFVKDDKKYSISWVRWTFAVGDNVGKEGAAPESSTADSKPETPLTLVKLVDCLRRMLDLGPGYVLDSVKIDFGEDGNVSGAVLEGLLPVQRFEVLKQPESTKVVSQTDKAGTAKKVVPVKEAKK